MAKPGQRCKVCHHPRRAEIEHAIVMRVPQETVARKFGISHDSVQRHKTNHLNATSMAALMTNERPSAIDLEQLEQRESESLLSNVVMQRARLNLLSEEAAKHGDVRAGAMVERAVTGNLEFVAKLLGQLIQRHEVTRASILVSPDYLKLRAELLSALFPFPDAKKAVADALFRMERDAAADIMKAGRPTVIEGTAEVMA